MTILCNRRNSVIEPTFVTNRTVSSLGTIKQRSITNIPRDNTLDENVTNILAIWFGLKAKGAKGYERVGRPSLYRCYYKEKVRVPSIQLTYPSNGIYAFARRPRFRVVREEVYREIVFDRDKAHIDFTNITSL